MPELPLGKRFTAYRQTCTRERDATVLITEGPAPGPVTARRKGTADDATDDSPDDTAGTITVMVMMVVVMVMVMVVILGELNLLRRSNLGKPHIITAFNNSTALGMD